VSFQSGHVTTKEFSTTDKDYDALFDVVKEMAADIKQMKNVFQMVLQDDAVGASMAMYTDALQRMPTADTPESPTHTVVGSMSSEQLTRM